MVLFSYRGDKQDYSRNIESFVFSHSTSICLVLVSEILEPPNKANSLNFKNIQRVLRSHCKLPVFWIPVLFWHIFWLPILICYSPNIGLADLWPYFQKANLIQKEGGPLRHRLPLCLRKVKGPLGACEVLRPRGHCVVRSCLWKWVKYFLH